MSVVLRIRVGRSELEIVLYAGGWADVSILRWNNDDPESARIIEKYVELDSAEAFGPLLDESVAQLTAWRLTRSPSTEGAWSRRRSSVASRVAVKADQRDRLGELLDAMEIEAGPVPAGLMAEARRRWQRFESDERPEEVGARCERRNST